MDLKCDLFRFPLWLLPNQSYYALFFPKLGGGVSIYGFFFSLLRTAPVSNNDSAPNFAHLWQTCRAIKSPASDQAFKKVHMQHTYVFLTLPALTRTCDCCPHYYKVALFKVAFVRKESFWGALVLG